MDRAWISTGIDGTRIRSKRISGEETKEAGMGVGVLMHCGVDPHLLSWGSVTTSAEPCIISIGVLKSPRRVSSHSGH